MSADRCHVLIVDDDARLRDLLKKYLGENGFRVTATENTASARTIMDSIIFDLIILDRMMPGETGMEFATSIRHNNSIPILMLTAMAETNDRISGFEVGADDYLTKPFEPRELLLRISSILRRVPERVDKAIPTKAYLGEFVFDIQREELHHGNQRVGLTAAEARLLKIFAEKPGVIFSRERLTGLVGPGTGQRTVDVQVNRLRYKIEPDQKLPRYLQTVRGRGYVLRSD
jgi:two-component system phosphate regulon response regulator OmpR